MARDYGDGTYGSWTYGGGEPDASVTTTTVARAVTIPHPHLPGEVTGIDITYLRASHDPSVILLARRILSYEAGHVDALSFLIRATADISGGSSSGARSFGDGEFGSGLFGGGGGGADTLRPGAGFFGRAGTKGRLTRRAAHRPSIRKRGSA